MFRSCHWRDLFGVAASRKHRRGRAMQCHKSVRLVVEQLEDRVTPTGFTLSSLASFNNTNGAYPFAGLTMDSSGNLYGTTIGGGASGVGTVFEIVHGSNTITTLASFNNTNGANPQAGLTMDSSGNLYGTTNGGGASSDGTVFELAQGSGTITTLASFNNANGVGSQAGLTMDSSGNLYGTTFGGGASSDGTVFELAHGSGTITTLASFSGTNGQYPIGRLTMDSSGNLYGTTLVGGASGDGTVFELVQGSGTITTLASFSGTNGANPQAGLTMDSSGNLYGTTFGGGASYDGTVFELAHGSNTIAMLASFSGTNGTNPQAGLTMDSSGNLYGTTTGGGASGDGTVFELAHGSNTITTLASFNNTNGANPIGRLTMDSSGNLYGTAEVGGVSSDGVVFELQPVTAPGVTSQPSNQTVTAGSNVLFTAAASGNPAPTVQWQVSTDGGNTFNNISGATGTTLTLDNVNAAMNGYEYQAVFTNSDGNITTNAATLTVNTFPITLSVGAVSGGFVGQAYNQTLTASGGDGSLTLAYHIVSGAIPNGLTINLSGNQLQIQGTPTSSGSATFTVTATDSVGNSTTSSLALAINPPPPVPITLSVGAVSGGSTGQAYNQTIMASGGDGSVTLTYHVVSGAIPNGLTFVAGGNRLIIQGTPTSGGSATFAVTATDSLGDSTTSNLTLTIDPPPPLNVPPLLAFLDSILGGIETINANGTETVTDSFAGIPLLRSTFDASGNLQSVFWLGFNITFLFV